MTLRNLLQPLLKLDEADRDDRQGLTRTAQDILDE